MACTYKASASSRLYGRYSFPETSDCSYKCTHWTWTWAPFRNGSLLTVHSTFHKRARYTVRTQAVECRSMFATALLSTPSITNSGKTTIPHVTLITDRYGSNLVICFYEFNCQLLPSLSTLVWFKFSFYERNRLPRAVSFPPPRALLL